ncbi:MAG: HAD family hydrolase [Candidatus Bathyarchaeia archaeon]
MRVKVILFDFGDTLVSFEGFDYEASLTALHQTLVKNGIVTPYEEFKKTYFKVRDQLYKEGDSSFKEVNFCVRASRVLKELGFDLTPTDPKIISSVEAFMRPLIESLKLEEHVFLVLRELKKKYSLGLVSNFAYPPAIRQTLRRFRLSGFFDAVVISGDIGWRKPSPKIFEKALEALRVSASEAVFVGDAPFHDIAGARQVGMKTVLLRRSDEKETAETGNPDKMISGLEELLMTLQDC